MEYFEVRGVPVAMRQDSWWLSGVGETSRKRLRINEAPWLRVVLLVVLIALADVLMWQVSVGASLAVFGVALVATAALVIDPQMNRRRLAICSMIALLSVLPVIEMIQPLSVFIFSFGLTLTLSVIVGLKPDRLMKGALRLFWIGPFQTIADGVECLSKTGSVRFEKGQVESTLLGWGLPIVLGAIFVFLFAQANPVLDNWLTGLAPETLPEPNLVRLVFWGGIALVSWPCFILLRLKERLRATRHTVKARKGNALINPQSIMRSLVIFNLLFAMQTGMDVVFLYGGGDLPDGMTYAKYAHRGAYPLVLTALLAGLFAMISKPFAKDAPFLRVLLLIWVVQNLALVVGSLVRLELYVDTYGLTHLRLAAFIWMGLVATCLCVLWVQIQRNHSNAWLMLRGTLLTGMVLYVCAFVSSDRAIVRYNLTHDVKVDRLYLCNLGESALPEIQKQTKLSAAQFCYSTYNESGWLAFEPKDWREWGFRNWRVRRSLKTLIVAVAAP